MRMLRRTLERDVAMSSSSRVTRSLEPEDQRIGKTKSEHRECGAQSAIANSSQAHATRAGFRELSDFDTQMITGMVCTGFLAGRE